MPQISCKACGRFISALTGSRLEEKALGAFIFDSKSNEYYCNECYSNRFITECNQAEKVEDSFPLFENDDTFHTETDMNFEYEDDQPNQAEKEELPDPPNEINQINIDDLMRKAFGLDKDQEDRRPYIEPLYTVIDYNGNRTEVPAYETKLHIENTIISTYNTLCSLDKVLESSYGEIVTTESFGFRTGKAVSGGLFCEKIFGPLLDFECKCGKYKKQRYEGLYCDRCGVEITTSNVRWERFGHIHLAMPVVQNLDYYIYWLSLLLEVESYEIRSVINFNSYIVIDPLDSKFNYQQILSSQEYREVYQRCEFIERPKVATGPNAIRLILAFNGIEEVDRIYNDFKMELRKNNLDTESKAFKKRWETLKLIKSSRINPEWIIIDAIPVIPAAMRPAYQINNGSFVECELNKIYRNILHKNRHLKEKIGLAPNIVIQGHAQNLQQAVNELYDYIAELEINR